MMLLSFQSLKRVLSMLSLFGAILALSLTTSAQTTNQDEAKQSICAATNAPPQQLNESVEVILRSSFRAITAERYEEGYQKALLALELSRKRGLKAREARASQLVALSSFYLGHTEEAIAYYKQAAKLAGETTDARIQKIQTTMLERAGILLWFAGHHNDALYSLNEALNIHRQRNDQEGIASSLNKLSLIYSETGDFTKASQVLNESLEIARTTQNKVLEAAVFLRLVTVENARGNPLAALRFGEEALLLDVNNVPANKPQAVILAELLYRMGNAHTAINQYSQAAERYEEALKLTRAIHSPQLEAVILGDYADSQFKSGNAESALNTATKAISTLQEGGGGKHLESKLMSTVAEAQRALGRNEEALASYRQAIDALELARSFSIQTEMSRAGIVSTRHQVFAGAIDFLLSMGRTAESLQVAEAYHARAFLDILAETGIDASQDLSNENKEREATLFERISGIQKKLWPGGAAKSLQQQDTEQELKRQLIEAENALELFQLELRRTNPRYATVKYPQPIKPEKIAHEILDSETSMIEFVLSDQRSVAWVIQKERIEAVFLPSKKEIEALIAEYRESFSGRVYSLTAGQAITKVRTQGRMLYQKIFQPIEQYLSKTKKLIIIPDGTLNYLPFETLIFEERAATDQRMTCYLIERFAISYAPSITALATLNSVNNKTVTTPNGFIAFGDPQYTSQAVETSERAVKVSSPLSKQADVSFEFRQLPWTRTEVNDVADLFPKGERKVFIGAEAKEESVKSENLSGYRYLHFAAHGNIDEDYPARSGIALSFEPESKEDGILRMGEVMRLKLNADLVTLSACRTGLGKLVKGEGIVGLTRSFLYAGADSVVVSLWNVNDVATATLMKSFYANLQRGMAKNEALRQAKLELISNPKRAWRHPYFWAPFVLVGVNN